MVEELTAQFRVCKHIKRDGNRCNSPAMTGMNFCFHHIGGKVASLVREGSTWDAGAQLDFPYPANREAIQQSLHLVAQALREGKIDPKTANTYIRIFRACEQNLHRWEKKQKNSAKTKMQPPTEASEATAPSNNTDAIQSATSPNETDPNGLSFRAQRSEAEEPALPPAPPTTLVIPTEVSKANEAKEPALPPAPPTTLSFRPK